VSDELKCCICKQPAIGVACSPFGAISSAYCADCLQSGREQWSILVGGLYGCPREDVHDAVRYVIKVTCEFYKKTEDEFWQEVKELAEDLAAYEKEHDEESD
jgi:hypothetical protein